MPPTRENNGNNNMIPQQLQYSYFDYQLLPPQSYTIDHLININHILNSNLITINNIYYSNYNIMMEQINTLKKINEDLEKKLGEKRKYNEVNDNMNKDYSNKYLKKSYTNYRNKYIIKKYYQHNDSWSEEKINEYLKNLKSIKDILELKHKWYYIRHNEKLAKLCNLVPAIEKLNNMIGLDGVKKEIFKIIIYYIQNRHTDEYLHTVITGPPGVGKTQIAKIYADIFVRLGILKTDKFIEIKRDDLVGQYLGQTAPRTRKLLENAMDGVIFLDEGYSLGNDEKRDSFAKEAIDMINQYLSERKTDFMFIIAGYEEDLDRCFFSFNKGLKRRFSHWIEITKYSKEELVEIFKSKVKEQEYQLDLELVNNKKLFDFFDKNYLKFENFAGDIEKFLNYIKYEQSFRTFKSNLSNKTINYNDLNSSIEKFKKVNKYEPPYGLYV
jgi:SpoVK/Ycf46/Vps4 family AAA+-type ATPase